MNIREKNYVEAMLKKLDWEDESNDKANLYYMTCILQTVIDWSEEDRRYFDEHYAFTEKFNLHGYPLESSINFSSKGIRIITEESECKIPVTIKSKRGRQKGATLSEETKQKMREAQQCRRTREKEQSEEPFSDETKRRLRLIRKSRNDKGISKKYSYMDSKDIKAIAMELVSNGINKITCEMKECKALTRRKISIKEVNDAMLNIISDEESKEVN